MDLDRLRALARRAVLLGGDVVRGDVVRGDDSSEPAAAKGLPGDWVTSVDLASEATIRAFLREETPSIPVLGEEEGGAGGADPLRWVVDPLDGTTNFVHRFPVVGVSVALVEGEQPLAGAVHAPFLGDTWHAARAGGTVWEPPGGGANACRVSERGPGQAVVATGFPFRRKERLPRYLPVMAAAFGRFEDLRRAGAACLDLAWAACGVFDGFFELGLASWDVAAGGLLVQEAGGIVTDWDGGNDFLAGDILAGPAAVHRELLQIVREAG